jgi:hypothetical protein
MVTARRITQLFEDLMHRSMPIKACSLVPLLAFLGSVAIATPSAAQTDSVPHGLFFSGGASTASSGVDAEGWHWEAGINHRLSGNLGLRLEVTSHSYDEVEMYPCLIQDTARCYQTMGRKVLAGLASLTAQPFTIRQRRIYLITGLGIYGSDRQATRYSNCDLSDAACDRSSYRLHLRDTQFGLNGGIGLVERMGNVPVFMDFRVHYVRRNSPSPGPSNDYFLLPVTIGF